MNTKDLVVVALMAVMFIGATAVVTEDAFAGKKIHYEKSQAVSQVNDCANGGWERWMSKYCVTDSRR